ncbi:5843_t:CDS:2 [Ambispora gerdemannii]|uniref:5843_t:CDS:1 n=1 Tax=Ambispora gerdemannii TaxID=144530 RepID=A0A9N9FG63_9GLOM|nr:5843_t:CDS:2 [Ambispora gerdemannii]
MSFSHCSFCQHRCQGILNLPYFTFTPPSILTFHWLYHQPYDQAQHLTCEYSNRSLMMALHRNFSLHKKRRSMKNKGYLNIGNNDSNGLKLHIDKSDNSGKRRDWELPRKTLHSSIGFIVFYLYSRDTDPILIRNYLVIAFIFISAVDALRFSNRTINNLYIKFCGFLMRDIEKTEKYNGVIYYLAGCIGALTIFPKDIAALSIIILAWCDTAASYIGRIWGHYTFRFKNGKSLAGTLGAMTFGALSGLLFWGSDLFIRRYVVKGHQIFDTPSWQSEKISLPVLVLLTGVIGGVSELIDLWGLDDNLVIPLAAGSMLWILLKGFSGLSDVGSWIGIV